MAVKDKKNRNSFSVPHPTSADLRGRQSVRATFRLSQAAIDLLSAVSAHLGIKQKSLFDHLMEDLESLDQIAKQSSPVIINSGSRVQKTFVLSRKTVTVLDRTCRVFDTPRDHLVEHSIQRLLPVIEKEKEKHKKRKLIAAEFAEYLKQGEALFEKSRAMLEEDDPVHEKLESGLRGLFNAQHQIELFIAKGDIIEEF